MNNLSSSKLNKFVALIALGFLVGLQEIKGFRNFYPKAKPLHLTANELIKQRYQTGDPLILTPLLEAGKIDEAQKLALVTNLTTVESYSGFFTVNPKYNSNLFFWFFPAAFSSEKAPVLLWLQGGPGGSSLFGLFVENGPFIVDADHNIDFRNTAWSLTHNVIYIDNPVGTGFSFTRDDQGYAKHEVDVANDLYSALSQFFIMFPQYRKNEFYATGESYAGKYVPAIAYKIHEENLRSHQYKINLRGMAIGDGFCDPPNMLNYGEYLYSIGVIDFYQREYFQQEEQKARDFIAKKQFTEANHVIDTLMDGDLSGTSYFKNVTGLDFYFNFLMTTTPPAQTYFNDFLQQDHVRKSIHVGNLPYDDLGGKVERFLEDDMYQSVVPWITALLDAPQKYKVLLYSGQLDIIVATPLTDNFLRKMKWHGAQELVKAERKLFYSGGELAGYVKKADNLVWLIIRDAGHILPYDQPKWSFDMINRFTSGKPFA